MLRAEHTSMLRQHRPVYALQLLLLPKVMNPAALQGQPCNSLLQCSMELHRRALTEPIHLNLQDRSMTTRKRRKDNSQHIIECHLQWTLQPAPAAPSATALQTTLLRRPLFKRCTPD